MVTYNEVNKEALEQLFKLTKTEPDKAVDEITKLDVYHIGTVKCNKVDKKNRSLYVARFNGIVNRFYFNELTDKITIV